MDAVKVAQVAIPKAEVRVEPATTGKILSLVAPQMPFANQMWSVPQSG